jgi:hypothetical protein
MGAPTITVFESDILNTLRAMVRGAYDLQQLRMQSGLRLCANFRARLKAVDLDKPDDPRVDIDPDAVEDVVEEVSEEDEAAAAERKKEEKRKKKVIKIIKAEYKRLTDGITSKKGRVLMKKLDLTGSPIISTAAELALVESYLALEKQEAKQFRDLEGTLMEIPIYRNYLKDVVGVGPAMGGVLISYLDPRKARHASSFHKYAGLDVDKGSGRSRREEHLVERTYRAKNGEMKTRMGVTYNPFLKTKLMGVLGPGFLRSKCPIRRKVYDDRKHRVTTDPTRVKVTVAVWKKLHKQLKAGVGTEEDLRRHWTPGRIHTDATRVMVKQFLTDLWVKWREQEGLSVTAPYRVAKMGQPPHAA